MIKSGLNSIDYYSKKINISLTYFGSLRSIVAHRRLSSTNKSITMYSSKSKRRKVEENHIDFSSNIVLVSSMIIGFFFFSILLIWWKRRRKYFLKLQNMTQQEKEENPPNPQDIQKLPKIGSILEGSLSINDQI